MEKNQMDKTKEENKMAAFNHWFRRKHVWRTMQLTAAYFYIVSLFSRKKYIIRWKNYFKSQQIVKKLYGTN